MYLSKLSLDPKNHQVQCEIANRYELHRTLTAQFPGMKREDIGLLYRVELPDPNLLNPIVLLVQTQPTPEWDDIHKRGMLSRSPQIKSFEPQFTASETFYFHLLGNPTKRIKQPDGSKRVGLYDREEQQEWLLRKSERGGFKIDSVKLIDLGLLESTKRSNNRTFQIKHLAIRFEGILTVTDPMQFLRTLEKGIGSAKAFGFGLLSLAKHSSKAKT